MKYPKYFSSVGALKEDDFEIINNSLIIFTEYFKARLLDLLN